MSKQVNARYIAANEHMLSNSIVCVSALDMIVKIAGCIFVSITRTSPGYNGSPCAPVQRRVTFGRGSWCEDATEANPEVRFNNVVSARWRRRTGQGACLIKYAMLLFNISIDNGVEESTGQICLHECMAVDVGQQRSGCQR